MIGPMLHPHSKAMLQAWRRLSHRGGTGSEPDPLVDDCETMLGSLFVLQRVEAGVWTFRTAGAKLEKLLGRALQDQDFLSLWHGADRLMVGGVLDAIETAVNPAILRARGQTLTARRVELEIPLAPLEMPQGRVTRVLGLYQTLGGLPMLDGRPIVRHHLSTLSTPDTPVMLPHLRLVASND